MITIDEGAKGTLHLCEVSWQELNGGQYHDEKGNLMPMSDVVCDCD